MKKTKIVGILMIVVAVSQTAIDALNGGGFDMKGHLHEVQLALEGFGIYFLRDAISKVQTTLAAK